MEVSKLHSTTTTSMSRVVVVVEVVVEVVVTMAMLVIAVAVAPVHPRTKALAIIKLVGERVVSMTSRVKGDVGLLLTMVVGK